MEDIRELVTEWQAKLLLISDILDEWLSFQRNFLYLDNIFNADDI